MPTDITRLLVIAQFYPEVVPWSWLHPVGPGFDLLSCMLFFASLLGAGFGLFLIVRAAILKSITKTDKLVRIVSGLFLLLSSMCLPFVTLFLLDRFGHYLFPETKRSSSSSSSSQTSRFSDRWCLNQSASEPR